MKSAKVAFYFLSLIILFNACKKEYSLESGGLKAPSGTWEFKDGASQFQGNMDTAFIGSSSGTGTKELQLIGRSLDGSQTFHMHLYADTFKTGTYKASLFQSSFEYTSGSITLYQASQLIGEFTVNITSLTNSLIAGTFSGNALDSGNAVKILTQGKFISSIAGTPASGISSGVLGDSSGNCKPAILSGNYTQGVAVTSANAVQVQVTVATAGTYSIKTDTLNGVSFSKTGAFTSTGVQNVILNATGTPTATGSQVFTVNYGNSKCSFTVNFTTQATGNTGGAGGSCTPFALAGNYQQGILFNTTNTVQMQVTVLTTGDYTITTGLLNGVIFSKTGTFTSTGIQTVTLTGAGTPVLSGSQTFTVSFGSSSCSFVINFLPGVSPSGDYFPLTANSNWTYSYEQGTSDDSVHSAVISYSPTFSANTYKTIAAYDVPSTGAFDSAYYRKPGGDYYQYVDYSNVIPFDGNPVMGEYIFLKDNVVAGTTWSSPSINGMVSGISVSAFIKMTLLEKAVGVTIGTFTFPDVIKVKYEYFITGIPVPLETDERWFARNVGEIHDSISDGSTTDVYNIGGFMIF